MRVFRTVTFIITILFCLTNTTCEEDDCCLPNPSLCDKDSVVNDDLFNNNESADVLITSAVIEDDCLYIEYSSSGCDASTWVADIYGSTEYDSSLQTINRLVRFNLQNDETCLAVFTRFESFGLLDLQVEEVSSIVLNLDGWNEELVYEYEQ